MIKPPSVSVLLPFYNASETLPECIDSILKQTLVDFEIIAVDDYSTDDSVAILEKYQDERIRIISNHQKGLVAALNHGLTYCRSNYVARMDADDLMYAERLQKQRDYLDSKSEVVMLATQVRKFPEEIVQAGYREYIRWQNKCDTAEAISQQIYVESPLAHPSVMFRKDRVVSVGGYRQGDFPEDYELWLRLYQHGYVMDKIPEVLLDWRESDGRLSRTAPQYSRHAFDLLRAEYLAQDPIIQNRPIVYWGAGRKTRQRVQLLIDKGFLPIAWIDVDEKKIGATYSGARVESPEWLECEQKPFVLNYVTNHGAREQVRAFLEKRGYRMGEDYLDVG